MYSLYLYIIIVILFIILLILWTALLTPQQSTDLMNPIPENIFPFDIYIINLDRKPERYLYIKEQLDKLGLTKYQRFVATDGFKINKEEMIKEGVAPGLIDKGLGLAGCATSHIRMWKHIANNKLGWTLILEDDAHFHPQFITLFHKYWKRIPKNARIIFPGYFDECNNNDKLILENNVMCLHGYMLSWQTAQYLLDYLLPINEPVDIVIANHFWRNYGSFIFNGNVNIDGIRPNDYKEANGDKCIFNGIIYQNREDYGTTIKKEETIMSINH